MSRAAREAVDRRDWDSVVARYRDLYQSLAVTTPGQLHTRRSA
jgi:hypothetical protein